MFNFRTACLKEAIEVYRDAVLCKKTDFAGGEKFRF